MESRIRKLADALKSKGVDAAVILQNVDLYYFAGSMQQGFLVVFSDGSYRYFVRKSYERAVEESPLKVEPARSLSVLREVLSDASPIGLEMDVLPASYLIRFRDMFPHAQFTDVSMDIRWIRSVKEPSEIQKQRKAAEIGMKVLQKAREIIKPGLTEYEVHLELKCYALRLGNFPIIRNRAFGAEIDFGETLAGENGAVDSYGNFPLNGRGWGPYYPRGSSHKVIQEGEPVIFDYLTGWEGYLSDQTDSVLLNVKERRVVDAYGLAIEMLEEFKTIAKAGVHVSEVYNHFVEWARKEGYGKEFMGVPFVGHGVGLEVDELPVLTDRMDAILRENNVVAFEPKFIFPGIGAVGAERTFIIKKDGAEPLAGI